MIHSYGQTWFEFGKGDIDLFVSVDEEHTFVIMENAPEPRQIGVWKDGHGQSVSDERLQRAPAVMTFSNVESIDAVILSLTRARKAFQQCCRQDALPE